MLISTIIDIAPTWFSNLIICRAWAEIIRIGFRALDIKFKVFIQIIIKQRQKRSMALFSSTKEKRKM
jgi:hypothetical protein